MPWWILQLTRRMVTPQAPHRTMPIHRSAGALFTRREPASCNGLGGTFVSFPSSYAWSMKLKRMEERGVRKEMTPMVSSRSVAKCEGRRWSIERACFSREKRLGKESAGDSTNIVANQVSNAASQSILRVP